MVAAFVVAAMCALQAAMGNRAGSEAEVAANLSAVPGTLVEQLRVAAFGRESIRFPGVGF